VQGGLMKDTCVTTYTQTPAHALATPLVHHN